ncbi:hypothetical protein MAM1_0220c08258 [Mucor ambiguus]|uniref:Uncharacterized protein n=1 Tax=Mucor ambiguus TaxID=91626 RepID=A0A0C9MYP8_9FUNG|nr:hypothetical protein MAM1_0220c08258 [Mucor ambiguus]
MLPPLSKLLNNLHSVCVEFERAKHVKSVLRNLSSSGNPIDSSFSHDPNIAKLVLSCLLEYAKLDLDPSLDNETIPKSHLWCIIRLRRLIHVAAETLPDSIAQISARLDEQTSNSTIASNSRLWEACLSLVHEERAFPVIERFVHLALPRQDIVDLTHFDPPQPLLPDRFLSHLAMDNALHTHAIACWSNDLKSRLLLNHNELLDTELVDLISEFIKSDQYHNLPTMQQNISQHHLLQAAITCPILSRMLMTKLASYVVLLLDWKVVRIMQSVYRSLEAGLSCKLFADFNTHQFDSISKFIYSGSLDSLGSRRNLAWCVSLASIRDVWPLVRLLIQQVYFASGENNSTSNNDMIIIEGVIATIIYDKYPTSHRPHSCAFIELNFNSDTAPPTPFFHAVEF